ncbi:response regulator transcription factor [Tsukamurella sp. 8F]|uniref:response regulator n=1 Tax=unclassified Tsukamurella TaxID=2633480 RepID=UPI0023B99AB6|nr:MULTISPECIES: response regulator transcription factor [unclassified Tsukamurella]MDF0528626.1 response regulator transcription factor [Tsukamurella sp. 8J]MDF0585588.1 response regulator transcription factor [Tsukamurella sp. 8F]
MSVRVLIADDDPLVCQYLTSALGDDIDVVATAADGAAAVEAAVAHTPDVALLDVRMPGVDGIAATAELTAMTPPVAVVLITALDTDDVLIDGLRSGAAGFILKTAPPELISDAVRTAATGGSLLSPDALRRLVTLAERPANRPDPRLQALTERERDVLRELGRGRSNAGIAAELYLAESTVKGYVSTLMARLDCANRTQLALLGTAL